MKNPIIRLLIAGLFFMVCQTNLPAQDTTAIDSIAETSGDLFPASFGDTILNRNKFETHDTVMEYRQDKDFAYMKYLDSLLRHTKDLTIDTFSNINSAPVERKNNSEGNSQSVNKIPRVNLFNQPIVKIILWVMAIFLIAFLIFKLFLGENFFRRNRAYKNSSDIQKEEEFITDPSVYDKMISQAAVNKNFRLAIRYLYLQALQNLSKKGILQFSTDKTNNQYVTELNGKPYQNDFASLTLSFEYVWYGKVDISEGTYNRLLHEFRSLQQKL